MKHKTMVQGFEWYLKPEDNHWHHLETLAPQFKKLGVTSIWLPPAFKGHKGKYDSGYGVYDLYDLGEFNQKGSIETKYGTKEAYLKCIKAFQKYNIDVIVDIVLNHRIGADAMESFRAQKVNPLNRNEGSEYREIIAWTSFKFEPRQNKYSSFKWSHQHFSGIDYDVKHHDQGVFLVEGKQWDENVSHEVGNYDYLMGADVDFSNPEVIKETKHFLSWYHDTVGYDGVRLDAIKHIDALSMRELLESMNQKAACFSVGEYWSANVQELSRYLELTHYQTTLFDVPLHHKLHDISRHYHHDLRTLYEGTLTKKHPEYAVQFVDNHDTQPGQSLESWIEPWFRHHANALILLKEGGYPCIFYTDLVDPIIQKMMVLRANHQQGNVIEHFENSHSIVLGYDGYDGYLCVVNIGSETYRKVHVGKEYAGRVYFSLEDKSKKYTVEPSGDVYVYCKEKGCELYLVEGGNYDQSLLR